MTSIEDLQPSGIVELTKVATYSSNHALANLSKSPSMRVKLRPAGLVIYIYNNILENDHLAIPTINQPVNLYVDGAICTTANITGITDSLGWVDCYFKNNY